MNKTCVIICGPTASGKTAISIEIAKKYNTEIISADSRQCYKELNIGVAKPSQLQLETVPHHFINSHSIAENLSAADFESYALAKIESIFLEKDIAIICGGTGLYIKAFCIGLDDIPTISPSIKAEIENNYNNFGINWLQEKIKTEDSIYWNQGEIKNPQRLMRALEVIRGTGKSVISFQTQQKKKRYFDILKVAIDIPREILYQQINNRVDKMVEDGLKDEVKNLLPYKTLNALQTVGYKEFFSYFNQEISYEKTVDLIKQHTRQYAKRQITWFKKEDEVQWMKAEDILPFIQQYID